MHELISYEKDYKKVVHNIRKELSSYILFNEIKSLVLGVSGGIDSAVVAALAKPVCEKLDIPLVGLSLPAGTNKPQEVTRARIVLNNFCSINPKPINIKEISDSINDLVAPVTTPLKEIKIQYGNIMARVRMILLYDTASKYNGMVLSTDNYTEYMLGFWTLHGDVGDYGPIQNLWKTEVYGLANYLMENDDLNNQQKVVLLQCIKATPTDGLGITDSDLDQIQAESYEEVDDILISWLNATGNSEVKIDFDATHPIIKRHLDTKFKRQIPINISRESLLTDIEVPF